MLEDVKQGYVSLKSAEEKYGVVIDEKRMAVDEERTKEERLKRTTFQHFFLSIDEGEIGCPWTIAFVGIAKGIVPNLRTIKNK